MQDRVDCAVLSVYVCVYATPGGGGETEALRIFARLPSGRAHVYVPVCVCVCVRQYFASDNFDRQHFACATQKWLDALAGIGQCTQRIGKLCV